MSQIGDVRKFLHPIFVEAGFSGKPGQWTLERPQLAWRAELVRSPRGTISMIAGLDVFDVENGRETRSANDLGLVLRLPTFPPVFAMDGNEVLRALETFDGDDLDKKRVLGEAVNAAVGYMVELDDVGAVREAFDHGEFAKAFVHLKLHNYLTAL